MYIRAHNIYIQYIFKTMSNMYIHNHILILKNWNNYILFRLYIKTIDRNRNIYTQHTCIYSNLIFLECKILFGFLA